MKSVTRSWTAARRQPVPSGSPGVTGSGGGSGRAPAAVSEEGGPRRRGRGAGGPGTWQSTPVPPPRSYSDDAMAPITVYGIMGSPPVRAVILICKALGVDYEFKLVNTLRGDHKTPEFLKLNPLHTVPVIQDGDFVLFDSHAIGVYLAQKSGSDKWYPKDLKKRAIVDQRLHFDNGVLFTRVRDILEPVLYLGESSFRPELVKGLEDALVKLDTVLGDNDFVAGSDPTIADCCCIASVSTMVHLVPRLPVPERVAAWMGRCEKTLPAFKEVNTPGVTSIGKLARSVWLRRLYGAYLGAQKRLSSVVSRGRARR